MAYPRLAATHVLLIRRHIRLAPSRISPLALRQQQTRLGQENAH